MLDSPLPIIDLTNSAESARAMREALSTTGFLYVRGHGVPVDLIAEAFAVSAAYFAQPRDFKTRFAYTDATANFGFQGLEIESLDPAALPDLKESFTMCNPQAMRDASRWPDPEFRRVALRLFVECHALGCRLLEHLGRSLELEPGFFCQRHRGEGVTLRFLHYPANLPRRTGAQLGAGEHTDYGSITLLLQDDVGGLEVQDVQGRWVAAPQVEDAILVNAGDLLERWTNGCVRSTRHRVLPVTGSRDRHSLVLFVDPDPDVEIACIPSCVTADRPARHPPITAREHILQKLTATHAAMQRGR